MHDGRTRKVDLKEPTPSAAFLEAHRASLTVLKGDAAGTEFDLDRRRVLVGRGDHVHVRIESPSISSEHAALELDSEGFGIRDLASTNGVLVNGAPITSADLKHGDQIALGDCMLQYVVEERVRSPRVWSIEDDD
jgi:pSer/pThr/pTyr-binding forkhead associated (FHA) protein